MNIMITGIGGGIGSTLGYFLSQNGHKVFGVDNFSGGYTNNLLWEEAAFSIWEDIDIRDTVLLSEFIKKYSIECIVHAAAITSLPKCEENPIECYDVNTMGTISVLNAAQKSGVKDVIFISTSAVYENNKYYPFAEYHPVFPILAYPLSKKISEEVCQSYAEKYGMRIPILRLFNVFGPRQDIHRKSPPLINYIVREIIHNRVPLLHSDGNQERDYVYVDDVCAIIKKCIEDKRAKNLYNVCSGKTLSVNKIYKIISLALKFPKEANFNIPSALWEGYDIDIDKKIVERETNKYSLGDQTRIKVELGAEINDNLEELIEKTALEIAENYV